VTVTSVPRDVRQTGVVASREFYLQLVRRLQVEKLPYLLICLTDFYEIWHSNASWPYAPDRTLKIYDFENPIRRTAAILKNRTITISPQPFD